jgi:hypothetical protein
MPEQDSFIKTQEDSIMMTEASLFPFATEVSVGPKTRHQRRSLSYQQKLGKLVVNKQQTR